MNVQKILFPTDFSHFSNEGLNLATSLARDNGATLFIVHVQEPSTAYAGGEMYYGISEPNTQKLKSMLKDVLPSDPTVPYEHHLITGDPASALVGFAKEHAIDLIVMGTHGRRGVMRVLMGSVAEVIVRRAPCPVLTYKPAVMAKEPAKV
jgi:nucleotide-binding universal stress UspA family protein